jgi:hypothetical protein
VRWCASNIGLFLSLVAASGAQVKQAPMVRLFLPADVPSNNIHIEYYLYGAFGAHGESIRPKPNSPGVMILPVVKGKIAEEIKLFAFVPGCDIKTFDIPIGYADIDESFACDPVPTVNLKGHAQ